MLLHCRRAAHRRGHIKKKCQINNLYIYVSTMNDTDKAKKNKEAAGPSLDDCQSKNAIFDILQQSLNPII
jgi:hypothetical protein